MLYVDNSGSIISYEEYYAYGGTSFQAGRSVAEVSLKRYRYIGKELDNESGFYYMGARYYVPWLCRWIAVDPINNDIYTGDPGQNQKRDISQVSASSYEYCYDSPIRFSDPTGEQPPLTNDLHIKPKTSPAGPLPPTVLLPPSAPSAHVVDNATASAQQKKADMQILAADKKADLIKRYGVPYVPPGLTPSTSMQTDPTSGYTPQQQATHDNARKIRLAAEGDPEKALFKYSGTSAQKAVGGINELIDKTITLSTFADGAGIVSSLVEKESLTAAKTSIMLAETEQHSQIINVVQSGTLPGSSGAFLGEKRLSENAMRDLSQQHGVEFAQVYTQGTGTSGGGGYYTLYSGTTNTVNVPADLGTFLVNHTHPMGNIQPSQFDVNYLMKMAAQGSPQKSSVILPFGHPASRFNIFSRTIGN